MKYLPAINPALDPNNCGTVFYAIPTDVFDNEFVTRVDYTINAKNNLYGRYFIDGYQAPAFFSPTNILITTASGNVERVQTFTLGENYTASSKLGELGRTSRFFAAATTAVMLRTISTPRPWGSMSFRASRMACSCPRENLLSAAGTNSVSHFNDNTDVD